MSAPYHGGCVCGAVRYRVTEEPLSLYACHCTDCQRHGGASFGLSMILFRSGLQLIEGEPQSYIAVPPDGVRRHGKFCNGCATRLWGEPLRFPDIVVLRPGTLDDTTWLDPVAHIWTRSAQRWIVFPPSVVTFETQPQDPMALINLWRERGREIEERG